MAPPATPSSGYLTPPQSFQRLQSWLPEKSQGKTTLQKPFRVGAKVELMCLCGGQSQQWLPGRILKIGGVDITVHWTDPLGQSHDDMFAADDSRIRHRRVSFSEDPAQVYAVPAHCEYYGVHPFFFSFDFQGNKVANSININRGAYEWISVKNKRTVPRLRPFVQDEIIQLVPEGVPSPSADEEEVPLPQRPRFRREQQAMHSCSPVQAAPSLMVMVPTPLRCAGRTCMSKPCMDDKLGRDRVQKQVMR